MVGTPIHIFHVSCDATVQRIAAARQRGLPVTGETCPQYLFQTWDAYDAPGVQGALPVCSPPIRSQYEQDALWQALARGEKMDWVLQKATELGAMAITPLVTQRSEVKLSSERAEKRQRHWQGVISSACEQSGRATLPVLGPISRLGDWCGEANDVPGWYLDPMAEDGLASLSLDRDASLRLVIGPEGGFDDTDIATLQAAGFRGLRLGPRVLRTETAGPAVIAALQALYGDLRG